MLAEENDKKKAPIQTRSICMGVIIYTSNHKALYDNTVTLRYKAK